ncbi:MAG: flippase [Treponema sp.]|nr:flippase [Treponema sp.]
MDFVFPVITFPYASRILAPDGIGQVNFSNSITFYFAMLAGLGVGTYATREAARIKEDRNALNKFSKEILVLNLISTCVSYFLFALSLVVVPKFKAYRVLMILSSSTIIFRALSFSWLYNAFEEFKLITLRTSVFQLLSLGFLFVFVRTPDDLIPYMIFGLIAPVGCNAFNLIYARKYVRLNYKGRLELKKHLKPVFIFFAMAFVTSIYETLDSSMLGFLSNDAEVGYYSAAIKINRMVLMLITSLAGVLLPRLSYYSEKNDGEKFYNLVKKSLSMNFLIALPCAAGIFFLSEPLMLLFCGEKYLPAVPAMRVMSFIIIIISAHTILGAQVLPAVKKEKTVFISHALGAVINIVCNSFLILRLGCLGAGIASVLAEFFILVFQAVFFVRHMPCRDVIPYVIRNMLHAVLATAVMSLAVAAVLFFTQNIMLKILLSTLCGALTYGLVLFILRNGCLSDVLMTFKRKVKK